MRTTRAINRYISNRRYRAKGILGAFAQAALVVCVVGAVGGIIAANFFGPGIVAGTLIPSHPVLAGAAAGALWGAASSEKDKTVSAIVFGITNAVSGFYHEPLVSAIVAAATAIVTVGGALSVHSAASTSTIASASHPAAVGIMGAATTTSSPVRSKLKSAGQRLKSSLSSLVYKPA